MFAPTNRFRTELADTEGDVDGDTDDVIDGEDDRVGEGNNEGEGEGEIEGQRDGDDEAERPDVGESESEGESVEDVAAQFMAISDTKPSASSTEYELQVTPKASLTYELPPPPPVAMQK